MPSIVGLRLIHLNECLLSRSMEHHIFENNVLCLQWSDSKLRKNSAEKKILADVKIASSSLVDTDL